MCFLFKLFFSVSFICNIIFFSSNSYSKLINRMIFFKRQIQKQTTLLTSNNNNYQEKFKTQRHKQVKYGEKANKKLETNANSKF